MPNVNRWKPPVINGNRKSKNRRLRFNNKNAKNLPYGWTETKSKKPCCKTKSKKPCCKSKSKKKETNINIKLNKELNRELNK